MGKQPENPELLTRLSDLYSPPKGTSQYIRRTDGSLASSATIPLMFRAGHGLVPAKTATTGQVYRLLHTFQEVGPESAQPSDTSRKFVFKRR